MNTTTNTTTVTTTKKVAHVVNVHEKHKTFIDELIEEFNLKSTKEAVELLIEAASVGRFYTQEETSDEGETTNVHRDKFEDAANKIDANRASVKLEAKREKLRAMLAKLEA